MNDFFPQDLQRRSRLECDLMEDRPVRLIGARGLRVQCLSGTTWITAHGEAQDIFLQAGESWTVPNNKLVLAEAVGQGQIRVEAQRSLRSLATKLEEDWSAVCCSS